MLYISTQKQGLTTPFHEMHAEEVHEIISSPPHWLVRWGATLFFVLISLFAVGTWWLRYPDILSAPFTLTTTNAPRAIIVRNEGKLARLLVRDAQQVKEGQVVAYSESTAAHEQILELSAELDRISNVISKNNTNFSIPALTRSYSQLGEVQNEFQIFLQKSSLLNSFVEGGFYAKKRKLISGDQRDLVAMHRIIEDQVATQSKDYELAKDDFKIQEKLFNSKVISAMEYKRENAKLISREMPIKNLSYSLLQNESAQKSKEKELLELENTFEEQKQVYFQSLQTLRNTINNWKQKYLILAPVTGVIAYSAPWQEQQYLKSGQELMTVEPLSKAFQGIIKVPHANIGKLQEGQIVLIKLDGFPYREYGMLEGKLSKLSATPGIDSSYWAYVTLPKKLTTKYGHILRYRNGMKGSAEIVTADRSLAERLLATIRNINK